MGFMPYTERASTVRPPTQHVIERRTPRAPHGFSALLVRLESSYLSHSRRASVVAPYTANILLFLDPQALLVKKRYGGTDQLGQIILHINLNLLLQSHFHSRESDHGALGQKNCPMVAHRVPKLTIFAPTTKNVEHDRPIHSNRPDC